MTDERDDGEGKTGEPDRAPTGREPRRTGQTTRSKAKARQPEHKTAQAGLID